MQPTHFFDAKPPIDRRRTMRLGTADIPTGASWQPTSELGSCERDPLTVYSYSVDRTSTGSISMETVWAKDMDNKKNNKKNNKKKKKKGKNGTKEKKEKKECSIEQGTVTKPKGGCLYLLCTTCLQEWKAEFTTKTIPSVIVPGDYKMAMGPKICPNTKCGVVCVNTVAMKTEHGWYQRKTIFLSQLLMVRDRQLVGKVDVPIIAWKDQLLYLGAHDIFNLTSLGCTIDSFGFDDGNLNT
jgi:hypothetical protein